MDQTTEEQIFECLDMGELINNYSYYDNNEEQLCNESSDEQTISESDITIPPKEEQITALVVRKDYGLLNPDVTYKIKKGMKMSMRSFLISLTLTFLNLFI